MDIGLNVEERPQSPAHHGMIVDDQHSDWGHQDDDRRRFGRVSRMTDPPPGRLSIVNLAPMA